MAAQEELVDLHLALEQLALGGDHRGSQLVKHRPGGLVTPDPELALKLLGADPGVKRRGQIRRPEPRAQLQPGLVHDRARRDRRLPPARRADPQVTARLTADTARVAAGADEPLRPPRREQVLPARLLGPEALLELQDRQRKVGARHATKLRHHPDGANPVRTN